MIKVYGNYIVYSVKCLTVRQNMLRKQLEILMRECINIKWQKMVYMDQLIKSHITEHAQDWNTNCLKKLYSFSKSVK